MSSLRYDFVHTDVKRFSRHTVDQLERETDTYLVCRSKAGQQAVIVPLATPQTIACCIECHTGHYNQRNGVIVGKEFSYRFQDAVGTHCHISGRGITAQTEVIAYHLRQQHALLCAPLLHKAVCVHLIGQRVIEQYSSSRPESRMGFEGGQNLSRV